MEGDWTLELGISLFSFTFCSCGLSSSHTCAQHIPTHTYTQSPTQLSDLQLLVSASACQALSSSIFLLDQLRFVQFFLMKLFFKTISIYSPLVFIQRNLNIKVMDILFFSRVGQNTSGISCMCIVLQHVGISAAFYEHSFSPLPDSSKCLS